jgi:hypothetical protein
MNFQEKLLEASAELRARAANLTDAAIKATRHQADAAVARVEGFQKSLTVLKTARSEFRKVARHHAGRFVKQNSPLFAAARKDVSELARSTYQTLTTGQTAKAPRARAARKRARKSV